MGWKTLKERFNIEHIVQVNEQGVICIGSGYVSDLVTINPKTGAVLANETFSSFLDKHYPSLVAASVEEVLRALNATDTFTTSLPVFTYDNDGNIIEKQCEALGWPNVTHDGALMYENTFFSDRAEAVSAARKSLRAHIDWLERDIREHKAELARREDELVGVMASSEKLESTESAEGVDLEH